jgi:hypothetical protein
MPFIRALSIVLMAAALFGAGPASAADKIAPGSVEAKNIKAVTDFMRSIPGGTHLTYTNAGNAIDQRLKDGKIEVGDGDNETSLSNMTTINSGAIRSGGNAEARAKPFDPKTKVGLTSIISLAATLFHEGIHAKQDWAYLIVSSAERSYAPGHLGDFEYNAWTGTMRALTDWMQADIANYQANPAKNGESLRRATAISEVLVGRATQFIGESASEHNYATAPWKPFVSGTETISKQLQNATPGQPLPDATVQLAKTLDTNYTSAIEAKNALPVPKPAPGPAPTQPISHGNSDRM